MKVALRQYATEQYNRQSYSAVLIAVEMGLNRAADGFLLHVRQITANTTLNANDNIVMVNASAGAVAVTLPIALESEQKIIIIKKVDASVNAVNVSAQGSSLIDGVASRSLTAQYGLLKLTAFNGNWFLV